MVSLWFSNAAKHRTHRLVRQDNYSEGVVKRTPRRRGLADRRRETE